MANEQNLKPFKKGGDERRHIGRPKGVKNRSTVMRELLDAIINDREDPLTGQPEIQDYEKLISKSIIKRAIDGDVSAYNAIMDSAYGKARQTVEQTVTEQKGKEFDGLSLEKKKKILEILQSED